MHKRSKDPCIRPKYKADSIAMQSGAHVAPNASITTKEKAEVDLTKKGWAKQVG